MKFALVIACFVLAANAAPVDDDDDRRAKIRERIERAVEFIDRLVQYVDNEVQTSLKRDDISEKARALLTAADVVLQDEIAQLQVLEKDLKDATRIDRDILRDLLAGSEKILKDAIAQTEALSKNEAFNRFEQIGFQLVERGLQVAEDLVERIERDLEPEAVLQESDDDRRAAVREILATLLDALDKVIKEGESRVAERLARKDLSDKARAVLTLVDAVLKDNDALVATFAADLRDVNKKGKNIEVDILKRTETLLKDLSTNLDALADNENFSPLAQLGFAALARVADLLEKLAEDAEKRVNPGP